jgi:hypothetical protein
MGCRIFIAFFLFIHSFISLIYVIAAHENYIVWQEVATIISALVLGAQNIHQENNPLWIKGGGVKKAHVLIGKMTFQCNLKIIGSASDRQIWLC